MKTWKNLNFYSDFEIKKIRKINKKQKIKLLSFGLESIFLVHTILSTCNLKIFSQGGPNLF